MKNVSPQTKAKILFAAAAAALVIAALVLWASFRPRALESVKTITVNINHADETVTTLELKTTARYLWEVLEPTELFRAADTGEGLWIVEADGETADGTGGRYWIFFVNGAEAEYTADLQPIADGDSFGFYIIVV